MEKEFVPYELAVKLKELGFDEPCIAFATMEYKDIIHCGVRLKVHKESDLPTKPFGVPTWQSAFRWFREKYGLRIRNYGSINYSKELSEYFEVFKYGYGTSDKSLSIVVGALTYEKAELDCLGKLIEIVEQTKA